MFGGFFKQMFVFVAKYETGIGESCVFRPMSTTHSD
jgi:hypothetical protein